MLGTVVNTVNNRLDRTILKIRVIILTVLLIGKVSSPSSRENSKLVCNNYQFSNLSFLPD